MRLRKIGLEGWCKCAAQDLGTAQDRILYLNRKLQIGTSERIRCEMNEAKGDTNEVTQQVSRYAGNEGCGKWKSH